MNVAHRGMARPAGKNPTIGPLATFGNLVPELVKRLGLRERLHEAEIAEAWSKIVGEFIAAHSTPVALREGILYVRVLHYDLEQVSKIDILRKLKQRFGSKSIRDIRFRVG
jgi:predicted nucleic acid-binding Zn ribbon protein